MHSLLELSTHLLKRFGISLRWIAPFGSNSLQKYLRIALFNAFSVSDWFRKGCPFVNVPLAPKKSLNAFPQRVMLRDSIQDPISWGGFGNPSVMTWILSSSMILANLFPASSSSWRVNDKKIWVHARVSWSNKIMVLKMNNWTKANLEMKSYPCPESSLVNPVPQHIIWARGRRKVVFNSTLLAHIPPLEPSFFVHSWYFGSGNELKLLARHLWFWLIHIKVPRYLSIETTVRIRWSLPYHHIANNDYEQQDVEQKISDLLFNPPIRINPI